MSKVVQTPLHVCAACGSPLCPKTSSIEAVIYTMSGPESVKHLPWRCVRKSCRSIHYYNYMWVGGAKMNTMKPEEAEYIFVTSKTGFSAQFLQYHDALQFRGYLSNRALAWAQVNVLWQGDHSHSSFRDDYALARFQACN